MRIICMLLLAFGVCTSARAVAPGERAPTMADQATSLEALHGRVVYVDFWASWCGPCQQVMPRLQQLYQNWQGRGLTIVGVNVDTPSSRGQAMARRLAISFPIVFDPDGAWPERFDLPTMPTGYLIDRSGVVRLVHRGYVAADFPALEAKINDLLKEQTPP